MGDDERMDGLLRGAMSAPPPEVPPTFVQDLVQRTAPRRLTRAGGIVVGAYAVVSLALCAWLMQDLPLTVAAVSLIAQAGLAVAVRRYARRRAGAV